jgi:hypothetical protein
MPKKRRKKKRPNRSKSGSRPRSFQKTIRGPDGQELLLLGYDITFEPLEDPIYAALPESGQQEMNDLHNMLKVEPRKAIPIIQKLLEEYPHVPRLYNYLSSAYAVLGNR